MKVNHAAKIRVAAVVIAGVLFATMGALAIPSETVIYSGTSGLSAAAEFSLLDSTMLEVILSNTSTSPFGGGGANMVLSSINFDLDGGQIIGGSVALADGSMIVHKSGSTWVQTAGSIDLNDEYAYSNAGVGNSGNPYPNALNSVTSHSNGGNGLTTFNGDSGLSGGLDFGGIASGSSPFGSSDFVLNTVVITLILDTEYHDLSFLSNGSYVEFGSDYAYVPGKHTPEPATLLLMGCGLVGLSAMGRKVRNHNKE